jgi:2-hydroxychromene-2-carboxylate isomerase
VSGAEYVVITAQVVGGMARPMAIEHYWDGHRFARKAAAVSHGFATRQSDDFNIGRIVRGGLESIWWMDENLNEPAETVAGIAAEVGLTGAQP